MPPVVSTTMTNGPESPERPADVPDSSVSYVCGGISDHSAATRTSKSMNHALMYVGGFERNFKNLTTSSNSFEGTDGQSHPYPAWPSEADGIRVSYMEKAGKKFCAVRVADGQNDVVLANDMVLVPGEHFGFGTRLSGEPSVVNDTTAIMKLLEDVIKKNHDTSDELMLIRTRFKAATAPKKPE